MSCGIDLQIDTGDPEGLTTVHDVGNYTSNVHGMWALALGCDIQELHGKTAEECLPTLKRAVDHMWDAANRTQYVAMNPSNGWGNFEGAREYLESFYKACRQHPKTTVYVGC